MRRELEWMQEAQEVWCPFYRAHDARSILCEGITDECVIRLMFASQKARRQQMQIFCTTDHCSFCELYPAIGGRYDDG